MESFFRIVSSNQWEEAQITGIIPKSLADEEKGIMHVSQYSDLEAACNHLFEQKDSPIALEFAPDSYAGKLSWQDKSDNRPWRIGLLQVESLSADLVLSVYGFEYIENNNGVFVLHGES